MGRAHRRQAPSAGKWSALFYRGVSRLWFIPREVFFGELDFCYIAGTADYDGARMDENGHYASYTATTAYSGIEGGLLLGSTLRPFTRFLVTPVAGAGIEYWLRNLDYKGPYGYTEKYTVPSLDAGVRLTYVSETHLQLFSTFLVRYPLSISETFTLAQRDRTPSRWSSTLAAFLNTGARSGSTCTGSSLCSPMHHGSLTSPT